MTNKDLDLNKLASVIDKLPTKKRIAIFIAVNFGIILFAIVILYQPINTLVDKAYKELETKKSRSKIISEEASLFKTTFSPDPNILVRKKISLLRSKLQNIDPALRNIDKALTAPDEMLSIIKNIVNRMKLLKLINMENIQPEIFVEADPSMFGQAITLPITNQGIHKIFKHGIKLELEGSYWELVRFLEKLEKIPKKILWSEFKLTNKKYPISNFEIKFYTLSLNSDWVRM